MLRRSFLTSFATAPAAFLRLFRGSGEPAPEPEPEPERLPPPAEEPEFSDNWNFRVEPPPQKCIDSFTGEHSWLLAAGTVFTLTFRGHVFCVYTLDIDVALIDWNVQELGKIVKFFRDAALLCAAKPPVRVYLELAARLNFDREGGGFHDWPVAEVVNFRRDPLGRVLWCLRLEEEARRKRGVRSFNLALAVGLRCQKCQLSVV